MRAGPQWFILIETLGILSFAINAMIVAERKKLSTLGVFVCAFATAFGGGTLRDALLGSGARPFFWVAHPFYVVAVFVLSLAYANVARVRSIVGRRDVVVKEGSEAIALASLGALGASKAFNLLSPAIGAGALPTVQLLIICALMGAITAGFGSVIRDSLLSELPSALRPGVWVLEALFIGASALAALRSFGVPEAWAILVGFSITVLIRAVVVWNDQRRKRRGIAEVVR